ncbi:lactadherin-like [Branchiostoma floridae]|uniref:Lactadherin-like n=1 Tax=Branchiostoma floridae TaxID=7739 RepID=A0A9J7MXQ9_BRAFL|nr:lactadherin-like [Branchiostoma floridae]
MSTSADEACTSPLGMESKTIRDDQITGSSTYCGTTGCWGPKLGRLHHKYAWYPRDYGNPGRKQWFQVDLRKRKRITGVQTQGHKYTYSYYVTSFQVQFSDNGTTWTTFATTDEEMVIEGNRGAETVKENVFVPAIQARFLRVVPWTWYQNGAALRLELLGCDVIGVIIAIAIGGVVVVVAATAVTIGFVVRRRRSTSRSHADLSSTARGHMFVNTEYSSVQAVPSSERHRDRDTSANRDREGFVDNDLYMKASAPTGQPGTTRAITGGNGSGEGDNKFIENVIYETSEMN